MKERNFLHPIASDPRFRVKDFRGIERGQTQDGTRLTSFAAINPAIAHQYRQGIMVEPPGQPALMVYGSYEEVQQIASEIKAGRLENVVRSLRPLGPSRSYMLNSPPPARTHIEPSPMETDRYTAAQKLYPGHDRENGLTDRQQEEKRAFREHQREVALASAGTHFTTSSDAQEHVERMLKPQTATVLGDLSEVEGG